MFNFVIKFSLELCSINMLCSTSKVLFICVCLVLLDISLCNNRENLVTEFSHHTIIKPKFYHGREKREISTTIENDKLHTNDISISYDLDGKEIILDLKLNHDLVSKDYFEKTQQNGSHVINKPLYEDLDFCHYNGVIRGVENSWTALSTCKGLLKGVLFDGKEIIYLHSEPLNKTSPENGFENNRHFIYKHQHLKSSNFSCGYQNEFEANHAPFTKEHEFHRILRYKRGAEIKSVKGPYNSNKQSRYVELLLVVDNKEFKALDENTGKVYRHCKDIANIINSLYSPLNIFIALVGVVIWTENDEISLVSDGDKTLTNFLHYRRGRLVKEHPNDNAQLLTRIQFDGGVVGKALKGPICTYEYSGGVSMDHSEVVGLVATTMAHEMGHNFGMEHDTSECECPDERCIMAASSSTIIPNHWSSCSLEYLALAFEHGMDYCLRNKPEKLFGSPVCGNGYLEDGEQCDCGLPHRCKNPCCDPITCKLHYNATCATGDCCNLETCMPKKAGTLCRSNDHECDLPEFCTGDNEFCPPDVYKRNTEECNGGKAFCYQGTCRTRNDQCKLLWGPSGLSSGDECYKTNLRGDRNGNCGYNRLNQTFVKCRDEHIFCGMLQCKHLNERLEFGMESVSILAYNFLNVQGNIIPCRTAIVDLGLNQVDPGLTPDGAKCGEGKMCVNQKCMAVASLRTTAHRCPGDCNGHGVCNSMGHCHCEPGYAPPFCDYPGPGGSEDSGPATDPDARRGFIVSMYVIFLGIVPLMSLCALLSFYYRQNPVLFKRKITSTKLSHSGKSPSKQNDFQRHGNVLPFRPTSPTAIINNSLNPQNSDELSSSLLQVGSGDGKENNFFGNFKGFSLTPLNKSPDDTSSSTTPINLNSDRRNIKNIALVHPTTKVQESVNAPVRSAPPVPQAPVIKNNSLGKNEIPRKQTKNTVHWDKSTIEELKPALPPLNPGSNARPLISEPILENSTCNRKELVSPLKHSNSIPVRAAPEIPMIRPQSTGDILESSEPIAPGIKRMNKETSNNTLNRIATFLSKDKSRSQSNTSTLTRTSKGNKNLDLKNLQISNPILQNDIVLPDGTVSIVTDSEDEDSGGRLMVARSKSMRSPASPQRPNIPNFGSMRQPAGMRRPTSIAVNVRPNRPPPPRPDCAPKLVSSNENVTKKIAELDKLAAASDYQIPIQHTEHVEFYDNEAAAPLANISEELTPSSGDNIYAVIDENSPPKNKPISPNNKHLLSPQSIKSVNSGSSESVGLLGEIVSEIQHRNFDSIYSASTLGKKNGKEKSGYTSDSDSSQAIYINTGPDSEYSVMNTAPSTTSSGYVNPSAINKNVSPESEKPSVSSIKQTFDAKASLSSFQIPVDNKTTGKSLNKPTIGRQTTPPNLRYSFKSDAKSISPSPKSGSKTTSNFERKDSLKSSNKSSEVKANEQNKFAMNKTTAPSKLVKQSAKSTVGKSAEKPPSHSNDKPKVTPKPSGGSFKSSSALNKSNSDAAKPVGKLNSSILNKTSSDSTKPISKFPVKNSNVAALQQKFENQK